MAHGHEQFWGYCLREWGLLGGGEQRGKNWDNCYNDIINKIIILKKEIKTYASEKISNWLLQLFYVIVLCVLLSVTIELIVRFKKTLIEILIFLSEMYGKGEIVSQKYYWIFLSSISDLVASSTNFYLTITKLIQTVDKMREQALLINEVVVQINIVIGIL